MGDLAVLEGAAAILLPFPRLPAALTLVVSGAGEELEGAAATLLPLPRLPAALTPVVLGAGEELEGA
jgi:hypothetical protein